MQAQRDRREYLQTLQFYEIVVCGIKSAFKAAFVDNEILDVARTLAGTRNRFMKEAENIKEKIIELYEKKDRAIDDANLIVTEIKAIVAVALRTLNHEDQIRSIEHAVWILRDENKEMLPKIVKAIESLNFEKEVLQIKTDLQILLDCIEGEKDEVLTKEKTAVVRRNLQDIGINLLVAGGGVAVCTYAPVFGLATGVEFAAEKAIIAYPATTVITKGTCIKTLDKQYSVVLGKLEDFYKAINESQMAVAAVQEELQQRGNRILFEESSILESTNDTKINANSNHAQFVPSYDDLKHATIKLEELCKDY